MPELSAARIRVVVCEDDDDLRDILLVGLPDFGMAAWGVSSAEALETFFAAREADILVLDLGLPGEDGFSAARRLRQERPALGILMLTARGQVEDRVRGLAGGADLYFVKPVDLRELAGAIKSLHRRLSQRPAAEAPVAPWRLDRAGSVVFSPSGTPISLTASEFRVLVRLMAEPGKTFKHDDLLGLLGWDADAGSKHRLEALVSRLRKKAKEACPGEAFPLRARHGEGYAFLSTSNLRA
ncbi:response regulator transcription factor [Geothrix sp. 21YS21S-4]|uniref:response regulator transcription factor n=1 Tax=Geothrix sp. 21YS21S-4 TaxID=3068889 RepID=UPI0027BA2E08|nr:response regulator transcription factor [Geothrix sp. 21YS21S-4]